MLMYVKAKHMAFAGVLTAITVLLVYMGTVLEVNTLFFLVAAAFCVGIAIREWGLRLGSAFWFASTVLNLLLSPNKLYGVTFAVMGLYIWFSEAWWKKLADSTKIIHRRMKLWIGKYVIFNIMYLPMLWFVSGISKSLFVIAVLIGQAGLFIFEVAYEYFQTRIWGKVRGRMLGEKGEDYGC